MNGMEVVEPMPGKSPALILAENSFRRLFLLIGVNHPKRNQEYLASFQEHRLYNVRMLLRCIARLGSKQRVEEYLKQIPLRSVHAQDLSDLLFGAYTDVEAKLMSQGILRGVDASGDWCELLTSLDIEPAAEIAEQLLDATDVSLPALLTRLRHRLDLTQHIMQDIMRHVPVLRETEHLKVLHSALMGSGLGHDRSTTASTDVPTAGIDNCIPYNAPDVVSTSNNKCLQVSGAEIAIMYLRSLNGDQAQLSVLRRLCCTHSLAAALLAVLYYHGTGMATNVTEAHRLGCSSLHWLLDTCEQPYSEYLPYAQYALGNLYLNGIGVYADEPKAFGLFQRSECHNILAAQHALGMCYEHGMGIHKDLAAAVTHYQAAAEEGFASAQNSLGQCYEHGKHVQKDTTEAMCLYRLAAKQGYAAAQANLANCYYKCSGLKKNLVEAVRLYRLALMQGHAAAQFGLGRCYEHGHGVAKDTTEAVRLYRQSSEQGFADAQYRLGLSYMDGKGVKRDEAGAVQLYRLAVKQGHTDAICSLGECYESGTIAGVGKTFVEAERLYRLAAEQGNATGQCNLGLFYLNGTVVPKNATEAVRLFRLSVDQGLASAQSRLGCCYVHGEGVTKDYAEGARFIRLASEQGHKVGQCNLAICYQHGTGVPKNVSEAVRLYRLSAEQGYVLAQYHLGKCFEEGDGVVKNIAEALRLYSLAAEKGDKDANLAVDRLEFDQGHK